MEKKGVSDVVGVVILIALVIGLTAIVWMVITGLVKEELSGAKSCFGNFEKVTFNKRYTCQDGTTKQLNFSISVKDLNISEIVVAIYGEGEIKTIRIDGDSAYPYAKNFADTAYGGILILPQENEGKTYSVNLIGMNMAKVDSIEIAPVIGSEQCDKSDSIYSVEDCKLLI